MMNRHATNEARSANLGSATAGTRSTIAAATLVVALAAPWTVPDALAQENQQQNQSQGQQQDQTQQDQTQQDQTQQDQSAQSDGSANNARADGGSPDVAEPTITVEFAVPDVTANDAMAVALKMAQEPFVARIDVPSGSEGSLMGTLVFDDPEAFTAFREGGMNAFFEPLGDPSTVQMDLTVFRPDLVREGDPSASGGLGGFSVNYSNDDNRSAGDADIDAVTVVCPGENAECSPSN